MKIKCEDGRVVEGPLEEAPPGHSGLTSVLFKGFDLDPLFFDTKKEILEISGKELALLVKHKAPLCGIEFWPCDGPQQEAQGASLKGYMMALRHIQVWISKLEDIPDTLRQEILDYLGELISRTK